MVRLELPEVIWRLQGSSNLDMYHLLATAVGKCRQKKWSPIVSEHDHLPFIESYHRPDPVALSFDDCEVRFIHSAQMMPVTIPPM